MRTLTRVFFLDDDDLKLVRRHRGEHMRAGFALQLATVRWLGKSLEDPLDVPDGVLEFVAGKQLGMADPSEVKRYTERGHTRFDHQWEIKKERGYREFDDAEEEFAQWAAARSPAPCLPPGAGAARPRPNPAWAGGTGTLRAFAR